MAAESRIPTACPVCGAYSLSPQTQVSTLVAVCDVLVHKALEAAGKFIVRAQRSRFNQLGSRPFYEAHTLWQADDQIVSKALKNAWDVVPALIDVHGCCGVSAATITATLDQYVHDLVVTGTSHDLDELMYRFQSVGLPVYDHREPFHDLPNVQPVANQIQQSGSVSIRG